jgi:RNA polymerase-binding transcription factor DksA
MAKKVKKSPAKKASKPAKKASKPAKKTSKPAKKKTVAKASKPAKKAAKPVSKSKPAKKVVAKKAVKPAQKVVASKPIRAVAKTAPAKTIAPVAKKEIKQPLAKKHESKVDVDDDDSKPEKSNPVVEIKEPKIMRPNKLNPVLPKPQINKDTRTRYTDKELSEFKELILKKLDEAQRDYDLLKSTLSHKDDHGTDDTSPTFKLLEDGSDVMSKEETAHLASRQEKFIQNLRNALIRIENKTYGICRVTGKLISKERLRSVPHATLSIDAKLEQTV